MKPNKKIASSKSATSSDIVKLILEDHKPLKKLLKVMKDTDAEFSERQKAFEEFAPLLTAHAKAEEKALYKFLENKDHQDYISQELRQSSFEGEVEHSLADRVAELAKQDRGADEDVVGAEIKVLAELVEHHIKEEEEDMFPEFKETTVPEMRSQMGERYLALKEEIMSLTDDQREPKVRSEEIQAH